MSASPDRPGSHARGDVRLPAAASPRHPATPMLLPQWMSRSGVHCMWARWAAGQVFGHGGKSTLVRTAQVRRHALAPVQQLHRARRDAGLQQTSAQPVTAARCNGGPRTQRAGQCELARSCRRPAPVSVGAAVAGPGRQVVQTHGAAAGQLLKRLGIELFQERCDGLVDVIDRGKPLVAQAHQNPALHHLHGGLDLAFVLRVVGPCGAGTRCRSGAQSRAPSVVGSWFIPISISSRLWGCQAR